MQQALPAAPAQCAGLDSRLLDPIVRVDGAAPDTQFSGAQSAIELKPGDEVRASFYLTDGTNQATSLTRESGGK